MNTFKLLIVMVMGCISFSLFGQRDTVRLEEVIVSTNRISLPQFKTSRTIHIISEQEIRQMAATNIADLLQSTSGIDIRRRGIEGTQSDLYIRGGNFEQTLLLIDGIKMDDAQTGHHTMNAILPLENIERIEIIKGPASRVFGQNAFNGAVNIVTKKAERDKLSMSNSYGSFKNLKLAGGFTKIFDKGDMQLHVQKQLADGYRYNTDFNNTSLFLKTNWENHRLLATFSNRKFGANGFYASPEYTEQYEETQTSLLAFSSTFKTKNLEINPRVSWRRNQDMYLFLRNDPSFFRNFHISNKVSIETNMVLSSSIGKTGFGIDLSQVYLASSNLGDHNRLMLTSFLEHRIEFEKFDITPGIAITHFSDFGTRAFPGIDMGYALSSTIKLYANIGYTYRIPTYTDLYYNGPTTLGNSDLKPESALAQEIGLKYSNENLRFNFAMFNRNANDLIDWTKENEEDKWQTQNFSKVSTKGFETSLDYTFQLNGFNQDLSVNYHFIEDRIKDVEVAFTRYSLNSIKHQFTSSLHTKFLAFLDQNLALRYIERTDRTSYTVVDAKVSAKLNSLELYLVANNIFNAEYTETNLVPMPGANFMFGVGFSLN